MQNKIASLANQIRKCAADLEYLAEEEELGFDAGIEEAEKKIAMRIERIASEIDKLDTNGKLTALIKKAGWDLESMDDSFDDEVLEDEEGYGMEDEDELEEVDFLEEDEEGCASDKMASQKILEARQKAIKMASLEKVATQCVECNHEEYVGMRKEELNSLIENVKNASTEVIGPDCEKCGGELLPKSLFKN